MTRAQLEGSVGELEVLQRAAQIARGESEHGAKRLVGVDDDAIAIHHQLRRRRRVAGGVAEVTRSVVCVRGRGGQMPDLRLPIGFEEQAPLDVQRLEGRALGEERFRLAQEKYAARAPARNGNARGCVPVPRY